MKKILPILGLLFLFYKKKEITGKNYDKYTNYFENIKGGITSHFPTEINFSSEYFYEVDTTAYFNTQEFNIHIMTTNDEIKKLKKLYNNKIYSAKDECIIVLNDSIKPDDIPFFPSEDVLLSDDMDKKYMTTFSSKCEKNHYKVIPNFWSNNTKGKETTKSNLDHNFRYIILDMKKGTNIYSKKLNPNISYMPDFAKHGYSKGIAFNEKENIIIYWLILW